MPLNDDALIRRAQAGDDGQAFAELVRRYQSRLRYSLRQLTGYDEALADDLAQETFIKAFQHIRQFRTDSAFFTWLYRIAWRCFADHYRKRKPEQAHSALPGQERSYTPQERSNLHLDFAMVLMNFGPEQRMALHLHFHREFTHREIAQIMECPLGTIKSHIQRGRPKLQQYLEAWQT
jgi:RNA polymerase sigma-70 factor (ECF subfamily)